MESKIFKSLVSSSLSKNGFIKKGNYFYSYFDEIIIVIGLQKSGYSHGYYINVGYVIRDLSPNLEIYKDFDGDVRTRFGIYENEKEIDYFDLDKFDEHDSHRLIDVIDTNVRQLVSTVNSLVGLKALLLDKPVMLYKTKLAAKQFLGIE